MKKSQSTYVRKSSHSLRFANKGKLDVLTDFKNEYAFVVRWTVNYLWNNRIEFNDKVFDIKNEQLYVPSFISTIGLDLETRLSGRAVKAATTQACGIVKSQINAFLQSKKRVEFCREEGWKPSKLDTKRLVAGLTMPSCKNINPELDTNNVSVEKGSNSFDFWLSFGALFKDSRGLKIQVPVKNHRKSLELASKGHLLSGIMLCDDSIQLRWESETPSIKTEGVTIAIDQGISDILTISDGRKLSGCKHGHTLTSILNKIARKKDGSIAHQKAVEHRENYIRMMVKQIDLSEVNEIRYENIDNIFFGKKGVSPFLKGWTQTLIEESLQSHCMLNGVRLTYVENVFNSQRCAKCGWTQEKNRNKKSFVCLHCKHTADADFNASQNILIRDTLFILPFEFRFQKHNKEGFFWNPNFVCDKNGVDLTVPPAQKLNIDII